jgi:hypothetical protein
LLQRLTQFPEVLNGSFFERELSGKARLYLSRIVNGTQRQVYISHKHREAVEKALKQYRELQKTIEQLCETNLQLVKLSKDGQWPTLDDMAME